MLGAQGGRRRRRGAADAERSRLDRGSAGWHSRAVRHAVETADGSAKSQGGAGGLVRRSRCGSATAGHGVTARRRVKEVQRRLAVAGLRTGPVNGVFGKRTQAAVGWTPPKRQLTLDRGRGLGHAAPHPRRAG